MNRAFVFPGQGSQAVGMGKALGATFASAKAAAIILRASAFSFGSTPSSMSRRIASAAEPFAFWMKRSRFPGTNIQDRDCFFGAPDMLLEPGESCPQ